MTEATSAMEGSVRKIFFVGRELRSGWRLGIFLVIVVVLVGATTGAMIRMRPGLLKITVLTPQIVLMLAGARFVVTLVATWVMARIEHREVGSYGLPLRRGFLRDFGLGAVWGFLALSTLLALMWLGHGFRVESLAEHGVNLVRYGLIWGATFIVVGLAEEFMFRGYPQFTLASGIGFWPAAIILSVCFAAAHYTNAGENLFGLLEVVLIALFFCLTLWRTGTLWFAVGYHAAWDWAETCLYGTADSGVGSVHHLLNTSAHGPHWLTGGSVGPEGSALNIPLNVLVAILFYVAFARRTPSRVVETAS